MSVVLWIKSADAPATEAPTDLWALYHFSKQLDRICKEAGVKALSAFHDHSAAAEDFGHEIEAITSDPGQLLTTLHAIASATQEDTGLFAHHGENRYDNLREDLDEAIRVATQCRVANTKARLMVVP